MRRVVGDPSSPPQTSRVQKPSRSAGRCRISGGAPRLPRSSRQARSPLRDLSTNRLSRAKTTGRKDSGMIRPLVRRQTVDTEVFKMHTSMRGMGPDPFNMHTAPRSGSHSRRESLRSNGGPATADPLEPDDINEKIKRMLAATEALKPGSSQASGLGESRRSRIIPSKVLKKISSAWGKIHARNADGDSFQSKPSAEPTDVRSNEIVDMNQHQKVWSLASLQIKRKPLPLDSHLLKGTKGRLEDADTRRLTTVKSADLKAFKEGLASLSSSPESPFDAEGAFESDLEDRILSTIPEASSTPRMPARRCYSSDYVPKTAPCQDSSRSNSSQGSVYSGDEKGYELIDVRLQRTLKRRSRALQFMGIKKHPSPDKKWLEALSTGFQQYRSLKAISAPDEDLDELADCFVFPPRTHRAAREADNLASRFSSTTTLGSGTMSSAPSTSASLLLSPRHTSRIPRPIDQSVSKRHHTRGPPFRPANADADSPDELQ